MPRKADTFTETIPLSIRIPGDLKENLDAIAFVDAMAERPGIQTSEVNFSEWLRQLLVDVVESHPEGIDQAVAVYKEQQFRELEDALNRLKDRRQSAGPPTVPTSTRKTASSRGAKNAPASRTRRGQ